MILDYFKIMIISEASLTEKHLIKGRSASCSGESLVEGVAGRESRRREHPSKVLVGDLCDALLKNR